MIFIASLTKLDVSNAVVEVAGSKLNPEPG
jgi:hypothetical protein